jgi:hypothetical protein
VHEGDPDKLLARGRGGRSGTTAKTTAVQALSSIQSEDRALKAAARRRDSKKLPAVARPAARKASRRESRKR